MVVFQFTLHQGKTQLDINMDILSREDATKDEKKCAKSLETFFLESLKQVAKTTKMELKVKKIKPKNIRRNRK